MKIVIHRIKEINERKDILPSITLGYHSLWKQLWYSSQGRKKTSPTLEATGAFLAVGIVGAGELSLSVSASRVLGLYYLPPVSQITVRGTSL